MQRATLKCVAKEGSRYVEQGGERWLTVEFILALDGQIFMPRLGVMTNFFLRIDQRHGRRHTDYTNLMNQQVHGVVSCFCFLCYQHCQR